MTDDELKVLRDRHRIHRWTWPNGDKGAYCVACHCPPQYCGVTRLLAHIEALKAKVEP